MSPHLNGIDGWTERARHAVFTLAAISLLFICTTEVFAQRSFSKTYPARKNVRLQLLNRSGTILVEAWDRSDIKVQATMESPAARFTPSLSDDGLVIDVVRDNHDRDVGDVNFTIRVPVNAAVDVKTTRGNITVRGIQGAQVYARVTTEGDIELTGIRAANVMAENLSGNILFDAELLRGGTYVLKSMKGDINLRIAATSGFNLLATAPRTRNIDLNGFARMGNFNFGDRRKVVGRVGDGGASLTTTNQLGSIVFMLR